MTRTQSRHWPPGLPPRLSAPQTSLVANLSIAALRYPDADALVFFGRRISYRQLLSEVEALAGYLQQRCGIGRGDRVLLQMQNCPQFVIAYYAILRADAVVVPVNPMLLTEELAHVVTDSGACAAFVALELAARLHPLMGEQTLRHAVVACYADYLGDDAHEAPDSVRASGEAAAHPLMRPWQQALAAGCLPAPAVAGSDDLACLPYTSGTTGQPKGCMHTHGTVMFAAVAGAVWAGAAPGQVGLLSLPLFHATGMQVSMNASIFVGGTLVIMPRWDRELAARLIARHRVTSWTSIPTMMIDFLSSPGLAEHDLSSLCRVSGGGAAMPAAIAQKLHDLTGLQYMEGYGLTETIATTHANPMQRPRQQCLGLPIFNVDSRIIDPDTHQELGPGEVGEIIIHGPQVFLGYWRDEAKTRAAFIDIDGKRFLRTGDLGRIDDDGYFFFTDRLKRMINASGYKVWPAEVEAIMYRHPEVRDCCIVGTGDPYRGETVKAIVVRAAGSALSADDLMSWARRQMAAYKVPRFVEFVDSLPKSATGKVMWRQLQDAERPSREPADGS
ncbi:MAG: long-chain fatty acid--CoA ligase [Burkholderiaceae bacterium]|nr:long-chain fatty acid--CoA ligase [Burkholderiaceae bacterium]